MNEEMESLLRKIREATKAQVDYARLEAEECNAYNIHVGLKIFITSVTFNGR